MAWRSEGLKDWEERGKKEVIELHMRFSVDIILPKSVGANMISWNKFCYHCDVHSKKLDEIHVSFDLKYTFLLSLFVTDQIKKEIQL